MALAFGPSHRSVGGGAVEQLSSGRDGRRCRDCAGSTGDPWSSGRLAWLVALCIQRQTLPSNRKVLILSWAYGELHVGTMGRTGLGSFIGWLHRAGRSVFGTARLYAALGNFCQVGLWVYCCGWRSKVKGCR